MTSVTLPVYRWLILQDGSLPINPDGTRNVGTPHRCTCTLVWPEGASPAPGDTLVVDPSLDGPGYGEAVLRLRTVGIAWQGVGRHLVTHPHGDHRVRGRETDLCGCGQVFAVREAGELSGLQVVPCPGHHERHVAVRFASRDGDTWVTGDAILGEDWLRAWQYYWPNGYRREEIAQTWRTVAAVLSHADLVIPGHGPPVRVTRELLADLIEGFGRAEYHKDCLEVRGLLEGRMGRMSRGT